MKKLLAILPLFAAMLAGAQPLPITQTTPPADAPAFYKVALNYFTAFNPELDGAFTNSHGQVTMGMDSLNSGPANLANSLGISYNVWKLIAIESTTRNSGIAGTILSQGLGLSLNFPIHDAELTLYAEGVVALYKDPPRAEKFQGEIGVRVKKALTTHTFAYVGMGAQLPKNNQIFTAGAGFNF